MIPSNLMLGRLVTDLLGLLPHLGAFLEGIGPFGLDPRTRELAALAVAFELDEPAVVRLHRLLGRAAGLTPSELEGIRDALTEAERAAIALALATVSRPLGEGVCSPSPCVDECYTSDQIGQLRAVALAVELHCTFHRTLRRTFSAASRQRSADL